MDDDGSEVLEQKDAYRRPLEDTITRLELLGYSLEHVRDRYEHERARQRQAQESRHEPAPFDVVLRALMGLDVHTCACWFGKFNDENNPWVRAARRIVAELFPDAEGEEAWRAAYSHYLDFEYMEPLARLRLLAENPANRDAQITWYVADVIEGGWVDFEDVRCGAQ